MNEKNSTTDDASWMAATDHEAEEAAGCGVPAAANYESDKETLSSALGEKSPASCPAGAKEHRSKDPTTGAEKGTKEPRFDLIPPGPLFLLARVYGKGAKKYADRNWEKGYPWGWSFAALMRHAWAFWRGEELDPESGLPHLAHAAWHCFTLMQFTNCHPGKDDRPGKGRAPDDYARVVEDLQRSLFWQNKVDELHRKLRDQEVTITRLESERKSMFGPNVTGPVTLIPGGRTWGEHPTA